jgi:hypothetical protein
MKTIVRALRWLVGEAWEKINVFETWKTLLQIGKKHGRRFFVFAVIWELIEDVLFPFISWKCGMPALIPFFLVMHFEPLVYPAAFWAFRMYDRVQGREPWEPDRGAQSSNWRSAGKVAVVGVAGTGWYVAILLSLGYSPKILMVFVGLMAAFGFIHERIWHDSNFGIGDNGAGDPDHVFFRRVCAKTATYALVSTTILTSLFKVAFSAIPWHVILACQGTGLCMYFVFEAVWARSKWGVATVSRLSPIPKG